MRVNANPPQNQYLAFVLEQKSRDFLLRSVPPIHPVVVAHHVTLEYNVTTNGMRLLGDRPNVRVIGQASNDRVQAVLCSVLTAMNREDGKYFHCTLSKIAEARDVESNDAIAQALAAGKQMLWGHEGFRLFGTVCLLDKKA